MVSKICATILILAVISAANALTCYKCDSSESSLCNYSLTKFTYDTVDCAKDGGFLSSVIPNQCVKITAKDKEGHEYVARGCMPHLGGACDSIISSLNFFTKLGSNMEDLHCYPCDGDKCNSAPPKVTAMTYFIGLTITIIAFLF